MSQRSPSSAKAVAPDRLPVPAAVQNAVKLMYAGAAVSTVSLVISLTDISSFEKSINEQGRTALLNHAKATHTKLTEAQIHQQLHQLDITLIGGSILSGVLGVALWLWMARVSTQGKNWARIVSTILFALATINLLSFILQPHTVLSLVFPVLTWLVGAGAIYLLWQRESTEFFKPPGMV